MEQQELSALVQILNRCPATIAEQLWLQALLNRLREMAAQPPAEQRKESEQ